MTSTPTFPKRSFLKRRSVERRIQRALKAWLKTGGLERTSE